MALDKPPPISFIELASSLCIDAWAKGHGGQRRESEDREAIGFGGGTDDVSRCRGTKVIQTGGREIRMERGIGIESFDRTGKVSHHRASGGADLAPSWHRLSPSGCSEPPLGDQSTPGRTRCFGHQLQEKRWNGCRLVKGRPFLPPGARTRSYSHLGTTTLMASPHHLKRSPCRHSSGGRLHISQDGARWHHRLD